MGVAFQLQDDWLDVYGDPAVFGKNIGGDILCNKKTYLLIKAAERADADQRAQLEAWVDAVSFDPNEKIEAVTTLYNQLGVRKLCREKIEEYTRRAKVSLAAVNVATEKKRELEKLLNDLMCREA